MSNVPNEGGDTRASFHKRRTLLKAGWTIPVVAAVSVPVQGFANNCSGDQQPTGNPLGGSGS